MCGGYVQCNLVVLPESLAYDFLLFAQRNPQACPVLEVSDTGARELRYLAEDVDIARDFPRYCVYENGVLADTCDSVDQLWREDLVGFLIGCSLSFEEELIDARVLREESARGGVVSVYQTNIPCVPAGVFSGDMVVSMRPIPREKVSQAVMLTGAMPRVHGAPVHIGEPGAIGIADLKNTDFGGGIVSLKEDEVPVFWACGVTPQAVVMKSKPEFVITHAPGHMLITDRKNSELK